VPVQFPTLDGVSSRLLDSELLATAVGCSGLYIYIPRTCDENGHVVERSTCVGMVSTGTRGCYGKNE